MKNELQDEIMATIEEMTKTKIEANIEPPYILSTDLYRALVMKILFTSDEFKTAVNDLVKTGKLKHGQTVNDIYLKIKK